MARLFFRGSRDLINNRFSSLLEISRKTIPLFKGVQISVTEEDIAQVSGLPTNGIRMFSRKHIILNAQQDFLLLGEQIEPKGRGVRLSLLPPPWPEVEKFIKHYLTCEG
jgi:hypothetical protein